MKEVKVPSLQSDVIDNRIIMRFYETFRLLEICEGVTSRRLMFDLFRYWVVVYN